MENNKIPTDLKDTNSSSEDSLITKTGLEVTPIRRNIVSYLLNSKYNDVKLIKGNIKSIHIKSIEYILSNSFKNNLSKIKRHHIKALKSMIKNQIITNKPNDPSIKLNFKIISSIFKENENLAKKYFKEALYLKKGSFPITEENIKYVTKFNLMSKNDSYTKIRRKVKAAKIITKNNVNILSPGPEIIKHVVKLRKIGFQNNDIDNNLVRALTLLKLNPSKENVEILSVLINQGVSYNSLLNNDHAIKASIKMKNNRSALTKEVFDKFLNSKSTIDGLYSIREDISSQSTIDISMALSKIGKSITHDNFKIASQLYNINLQNPDSISSRSFNIAEKLYYISDKKEGFISLRNFGIAEKLVNIKKDITLRNFKVARKIYKINGNSLSPIDSYSIYAGNLLYDINNNSSGITSKNFKVIKALDDVITDITPDNLDVAFNIYKYRGLDAITSQNMSIASTAKQKFGKNCSYLDVGDSIEKSEIGINSLDEVDEYKKVVDKYAETNDETIKTNIAINMKKFDKVSPESVKAIEGLLLFKSSNESITKKDIYFADKLIKQGKMVNKSNMLIISVMDKHKKNDPQDREAIRRLLKLETPDEIYDDDIHAAKELIKIGEKINKRKIETAKEIMQKNKNIKDFKKLFLSAEGKI